MQVSTMTRMNLSIALTAAIEGAVIANHVEVISLIKDKVCLNEEQWKLMPKLLFYGTYIIELGGC